MNIVIRFYKYIYYKFRLNYVFSWFDRLFTKSLDIMNAKETIDYIIDNKASICRFGDGEFQMLTYGWDTGFQHASPLLIDALRTTLSSSINGLLICISNRINMRSNEDFLKIPESWKKLIKYSLHDWLRFIPKQGHYGDANISRLTDIDIFGSKINQIQYTKRIWDKRNVIIAEGSGTVFGVGNDLLSQVLSCKRIITPEKDAFNKYEEIRQTIIRECDGVESPLVLLALGPTATVLAADICKEGIQTIDIGHLDLVYEMELRGIKQGESVPGRYTNEAVGGDQYEPCLDKTYLSQIVCKIVSE